MSALLALFLRSLRLYLRARTIAVVHVSLVGIILLLLFTSHATATMRGAPGLDFFGGVMMLNLAFLTLAAISYFASAITEEKEEGTLGLLQMTDLDPLAILLGKSTTRLCAALLLLVVQVPFTLLAVTLGGISAHQIFAAYVTLGAYAFFLSNLALLASVLAPRTSIAAMFTGGFLLFMPSLAGAMIAAPKLAGLPHFRGKADAAAATLAEWGAALLEASPFHHLGEITRTGFSGAIFGWQAWSNLGGGLLCFGLAWAFFNLATGERRLFISGRIVPRPGSRFARFCPDRAWPISAIAWKDFHFIHGGELAILGKFLAYALLCGWQIYEAIPDPEPFGTAARGILGWVSFAMMVELGMAGSRIFREEVRNKTLVGLAALPFAMKHIGLMKIDGAKRTLLPAKCALLLGAIAMFADLATGFGNRAFPWIGMLLLFAYLWTQTWLFAHLAAYTSLRLRWGALPVSFAICFIGNILGLTMCFGIFVAPIVALILVPTLRESIYLRLEELAGED